MQCLLSPVVNYTECEFGTVQTARLRPPVMSLENSAEGAEKQRRDTGAVNQIDPEDSQRRSPRCM